MKYVAEVFVFECMCCGRIYGKATMTRQKAGKLNAENRRENSTGRWIKEANFSPDELVKKRSGVVPHECRYSKYAQP